MPGIGTLVPETSLGQIGYPGNFKVSGSLSGGSIILLSLSGSGVLGYPGLTDPDIRTKKSRYPDLDPALVDPAFYYLDPDTAPPDIRIFGSDPDRISDRIRILDKSLGPTRSPTYKEQSMLAFQNETKEACAFFILFYEYIL
ncbi:hypothetical protein YC2023_099422 [Brassica napus]